MICGRPLTSPESRLARVGSTCIQQHGPRYANIPNPEFARWQNELDSAERSQKEQQAVFDQQHQSALAEYEILKSEWDAKVESPAGQARRRNRAVGRKLFFAGAFSALFLLVTFSKAGNMIESEKVHAESLRSMLGSSFHQ